MSPRNFDRYRKFSRNSNNKQSKLCYFGYIDYLFLASALAIALAEELSNDDVNILSGFFATLADELALIAAVGQCSSNNDDSDNDVIIPPAPDAAAVAVTRGSKKIIKKQKKKKVKKIKKTV